MKSLTQFKKSLERSCHWYVSALLLLRLLSQLLCKFESGAAKVARRIVYPRTADLKEAARAIPNIQVMIQSGLNLQKFRDLAANTMSKLVRIPGIVISASVLSSRATRLHLQCRACRSTEWIEPSGGLGGVGGGSDRGLPRVCKAPTINFVSSSVMCLTSSNMELFSMCEIRSGNKFGSASSCESV